MAEFHFYSTNVSLSCVPSEHFFLFFKLPDTLTVFIQIRLPYCAQSKLLHQIFSEHRAGTVRRNRMKEAWPWPGGPLAD